MRRKYVIILLVLIFVLTGQSFANNELKIKINEKAVDFSENTGEPFIESGRTLVPLRVVVESLNAQVSWDHDLRQAVVKKNETTVIVPIGASYIYKNDKKIENDSKALILNGRTFLPIRVVMEAFGYDVKWEEMSRSILINQKNKKSINPIDQSVTINGGKIQVNGFKVDLKDENIKVKTALAKNAVGQVDTLENIAKANEATLAINGSYFSA